MLTHQVKIGFCHVIMFLRKFTLKFTIVFKNNRKLEKSLTWYVASYTPPVLGSMICINYVIVVLFLNSPRA